MDLMSVGIEIAGFLVTGGIVFGRLQTKIQDQKEEIKNMKAELSKVRSEISNNKEKIECYISESLESLKETINRIDVSLQLQMQMLKNFTDVTSQKFIGIDLRIDGIHGDIRRHEKEIHQLGLHSVKIEQKLELYTKRDE